MAEKRLSRLQKFILTEAYKKGRRNVFDEPNYYDPKTKELTKIEWENEYKKRGMDYLIDQYWIGSREIHERFFGQTRNPVKNVILSRSVRKLFEHGYLRSSYYEHLWPHENRLIVSDFGVKIAKSIISSIVEPIIQ
jgi:hypothetical protein